MKVFVVKMNRYGDREKHSYVLGVWSTWIKAQEAGLIEESYRIGKYEPEIFEFVVDANEYDVLVEEEY